MNKVKSLRRPLIEATGLISHRHRLREGAPECSHHICCFGVTETVRRSAIDTGPSEGRDPLNRFPANVYPPRPERCQASRILRSTGHQSRSRQGRKAG